jgi:hypothetical protein
MPVKAYCVTGPTTFSQPSGRGGARFPDGGTSVAATAAVSGGNLTVTTNPAVTNGTTVYCVAVFDASAD